MAATEPTLEHKLARIAEYERTLRPNGLTRALVRMAPTRAFARFYRWFGPLADPWLYRRTGGRAHSRVFGLPTLVLTTTGARSGLPRTSPLLYVRDGEDFALVGTNFGQQHHPAWTGNLLADPSATVEIADQRIAVTARPAPDEDRARVWPRFLAVYPGYAAYQARSGRVPRMFLLHPRSGG